MPVERGGDSKQGLIISVVFLSILVVVLGVTTFLGYRGQKELSAAARKADEEKKLAERGRDWEKFKDKQLAAYVGVASPSDTEDLGKLRGDYDSDKFKDEVDLPAFKAGLTKLDDPQTGPGWDPAQKKPVSTLLGQVAALTGELKNQKALYDKAERENKNNLDEMNQRLQSDETKITSLQNQLSTALAQAANAINEKSKAFLDLTEQDARTRQEKEDAQKAALGETQGRDKQIAALQHDIKELQKGNDKLRAAVAPIDVTKYDQAKGKIITIRNSFAYINLGAADNVKADLTFSVYKYSADGRAEGDRKAALEVVKVVAPHVSAARVTQIRDASRDPIMEGDLLFNPIWSPSAREHVAIAGLIDLNGDGRDSTAEFVHSLQQQGIIVDAYLDLKDSTIKGNGMTMQTNYLVVGANPDLDPASQLSKGNTNSDHKKEVLELIGKMRTQADQLGVQVLGAQRFMTLIGYKLPAGAARPDYDARPQGVGSLEGSSDSGIGDEGAKPAKAAPKKPPKKDEDEGGDKDK